MNRTFTPRLEPAVLERLVAYANRFRPHFNHPRQALWSEVYLRGLSPRGRTQIDRTPLASGEAAGRAGRGG